MLKLLLAIRKWFSFIWSPLHRPVIGVNVFRVVTRCFDSIVGRKGWVGSTECAQVWNIKMCNKIEEIICKFIAHACMHCYGKSLRYIVVMYTAMQLVNYTTIIIN